MDNLVFALNTTMPIFLMMLLGALFRKLKWMSEDFASKINKFVFMIPLPVLLFKDLAEVDFTEVWDGKFVLFCFLVTLASIALVFLISLLFRDRTVRGEFIQSSYRSSAALLGIAIITNIYGNSGMAPLMIIGSVPLYNVFAVLVLMLTAPQEDGRQAKFDGKLMKKTLLGILKNPILIGIEVGMVWSLLKLPLPTILEKTVSGVAATATPLGLMSMGAIFDLKKAKGKLAPALTASFIKLFGLCMIFVPVAVLFGFRTEQLIAILIMLGSATTVSSFTMARNMGHEGTVSSSVVMITTVLAAFSLTFWLWLLKTLSLI